MLRRIKTNRPIMFSSGCNHYNLPGKGYYEWKEQDNPLNIGKMKSIERSARKPLKAVDGSIGPALSIPVAYIFCNLAVILHDNLKTIKFIIGSSFINDWRLILHQWLKAPGYTINTSSKLSIVFVLLASSGGKPPDDHDITVTDYQKDAVSFELLVSMAAFASVGIAMAYGFLAFNVFYRNERSV